jgi:hypothetical protein
MMSRDFGRGKGAEGEEANREQKGAVRTSVAKSGQQTSSSKAVASPTVWSARKMYSEKERAQKLGEIAKQIGRGESIRVAVQKGVGTRTVPADALKTNFPLEAVCAKGERVWVEC